jgi:hypothetical protein
MDNKIIPIEKLVKEGLVQNFRKVFDADLTITNTSNKRELVAKRAQGRALKYPIAFAELNSVALPTQGAYRSQALLRRGLTGQATSDNLGTFKVSMIPMDSAYQILFITNDFSQAEKFGKLWLMAAVGGFLKFSIMYGVVDVGISLELDRQVSFPQRDASPGTVEEYEVTANLVVNGYASHDALMNQQAAMSVETTMYVTNESDKALMQEDSPGTVQVFKFNREWPHGSGPLTS